MGGGCYLCEGFALSRAGLCERRRMPLGSRRSRQRRGNKPQLQKLYYVSQNTSTSKRQTHPHPLSPLGLTATLPWARSHVSPHYCKCLHRDPTCFPQASVDRPNEMNALATTAHIVENNYITFRKTLRRFNPLMSDIRPPSNLPHILANFH